MRVAILTTGQAEWLGMDKALGRLFPEHSFECLPYADEVASNEGRFPTPGFTSTPLTEANEQDAPESARELVLRAAQAVIGTSNQEAADLAIILDDLELANAHQPDRVVRVMRSAVKAHISHLPSQALRDRTAKRLAQQVSFHILAPMLESWFFADPTALIRAGVPADRMVAFDAETDPEDFVTSDPDYSQATEDSCPRWQALPGARQSQRQRNRKLRPRWLGDDRLRHPKGYLQWLCVDPHAPTCTTYSEVDGGAKALSSIDWAALCARPTVHFSLLRALIDDLECDLGPSSCGPVTGSISPLTSRRAHRDDPVLRNL